jgi:hypothetical protein
MQASTTREEDPMIEILAGNAASGPLGDLAKSITAQVGDFAPYWGLLALKGADFVTGVMRAVAQRDVQPAKLLHMPQGIAVLTVMVAMCLSMNAVSPVFEPIVTAILVAYGGSEAASIIQNLHDWYVVRGQAPPPWLAKAASTLATMEVTTPPGPAGPQAVKQEAVPDNG